MPSFVLFALAVTTGVWLLFVLVLVLARPKGGALGQGTRMLPDTVRLVRKLTTDASVPRSARVLVWLLLGYLVLPIDLVPDFLPVIGYIDDLILTALVLHYLVRRAGPDVLERQWPGSDEGLAALRTLLGIPKPSSPVR